MKTIVIAGAHSNVGKTGLAGRICSIVKGAVHIKIGHGPVKKDMDNIFFPQGTPFREILERYDDAPFLVIESGAITAEFEPDCLIYLPGGEPKPGADEIRKVADLVRGESAGSGRFAVLAGRLGLSLDTIGRIADAAEVQTEVDKTVKEMITFDEAFAAVMTSASPLGSEEVSLDDAAGRVLFEDILSDMDMPPFDKSAMDGYACRKIDLAAPMKIVATLPAGELPTVEIDSGECVKIMTGAAVPAGADVVVKVEDTEESGGMMTVTGKSNAINICYRAEDVSAGDTVLRSGSLIGPVEIAVLAAVGRTTIKVFRKPRIGIIATGSELVEPGEKPSGAQIRNSNSYQLVAQATLAGFDAAYMGIAGDSPEEIATALDGAAASSDIVILSGGVSMGDYDYVPGVIEKNGFDILFRKVAIKPGKPTVFARGKDKFIFGLPGNPVSTFVLFEILVRPFASLLMGMDYDPVKAMVRLSVPVTRKKAVRKSYIPVVLDGTGTAGPVEYHGSAHIHAYAGADGIISMEPGVSRLEKGEEVDVILL
ncbi:MAG: molybdopterin molybdotransferase MoeA [Candidatus Krumholzibacteria bacterium]|nr:molybdopterin molybdotransferase MoeA [Candidatus Krumholzibacteria bacterium]